MSGFANCMKLFQQYVVYRRTYINIVSLTKIECIPSIINIHLCIYHEPSKCELKNLSLID